MKVAIGIDGSELSYQAVRFTSKLLSPRVDDLLLFFSPPEFHLASKTPLPDEVLKSAAWALAAGVFDNAVNCLSPEMQDITSTMRSDRLPADGLVELAEKEDVDLVVVGSVSAKRKFPYLLGSTARSIIHNTDKPVLVVRGEKAVAKGAMKVLVACDRDRWVDATGVLRDFSWPDGTEATLFHVVEAYGDKFVESLLEHGSSRVPNSVQMVEEYRQAIERQKSEFAEHIKSLKDSGPTLIRDADIEVLQGDVVEEIVAKVEQMDADLLVVSSRKLSTIGRMLGSVTESLLTRCPCSILIVHDQEISDRTAPAGAKEQLA